MDVETVIQARVDVAAAGAASSASSDAEAAVVPAGEQHPKSGCT